MSGKRVTIFAFLVLFSLLSFSLSFAQEMTYSEAPMLAERVAAGELPPVEERLPVHPDVVTPVEEVGTYGGSLNLIASLPISWGDAANAIRARLIERDRRTPDEFLPGLAESWELSEDGTVFTLTLREGLKWSDGVPFTTDDLLFMWEDIQMNPEVRPEGPMAFFNPGGEPMQVEKIDDLTIRYTFAVPYFSAPIYFSGWGDYFGTQETSFQAKHVLSQFHITYNPDADTLAQDAGFEHWYELFNTKLVSNGVHDPGVPGMGPWVPKELAADGIILERNPFYYRVDTAGNQLPYIDSIRATYIADNAARVLAVSAGDVDFWINANSSLADYPVFSENEAAGDYTAYLLDSGMPANVVVHVNMNYTPLEGEDPFLAELLRDARFRQALSLALNRDEVNELVFLGTGTPTQLTWNRNSSVFRQEWADAFAAYDTDQANALLDELGLTRGADGFRTRPDGSPLELVFEVPQQLAPNVQSSELLARHWQDVGIKINLKIQDIGLVVNHLVDSSFQITTFGNEQGGDLFLVIQGAGMWNIWASSQKWFQWNASGGTSGEEPPDWLIDVFEKLAQREQVPFEQVLADATEILQLQADNVFAIGVIGYAQAPGIVKNGLRNTDPTFHDIWEWNRLGGHRPDQWFWDQSS